MKYKGIILFLFLAITVDLIPSFVSGATSNIALNQSVTADTNSQLGSPSDIVDGSYDNYWYSYQGEPTEQAFVLDLGNVYSIEKVDLHVSQIYGVTVSTSTDGTSFTDRFHWTGESYAGLLSFSGDGTYQARYIKYYAYANWNQYVGISEIEVWGDTPGEKPEGLDVPSGISLIDKTDNPADAPVSMGEVLTGGSRMELSMDFPAYNAPVDIWVAVALPDGRFFMVDAGGNFVSLESIGLVPVAIGVSGTPTILQELISFETGAEETPFSPWPEDGEWVVYWLIAPGTTGDMVTALENENYELGFYIFQIQSDTKFTLMTNPTDSHILSATGADGTTIHYYGDRDTDGIPTNIDLIDVVDADGMTTMIQLDPENRPYRIRTSDGVVFELDYYLENRVGVTAISPDGTVQVNTAVSTETDISKLSMAHSSLRKRTNADEPNCFITVKQCGAPVTNALVSVDIQQPGDILNSWHGVAEHVSDGTYGISLPTSGQVSLNGEDLRAASEEIAAKLGNICTTLSVLPPIELAICPAIGTLLTTVTGPGGAAIAAGCLKVSAAVKAYCETLGAGIPGDKSLGEKILQALQDPNVLSGTLTIYADARIPGVSGNISQTVTAPAGGPFPTIELSDTISHRMGSITISPNPPEVLQSYDIHTQILCPDPGDQLTLEILREDDREVPVPYSWSFSEIETENSVTLTRSMPATGEYSKTTDTITATLTGFNDIVAGSRTIIVVTEKIPPVIHQLSPKEGSEGTPVTITGSNFGDTQGWITFNGISATVTSWSDTQIETLVPAAGSGDVVVTDTFLNRSNGEYFTVYWNALNGVTDIFTYLSISYGFSVESPRNVSVKDMTEGSRYSRKITAYAPTGASVCLSGSFIINAPENTISRYDLNPFDGTRINEYVADDFAVSIVHPISQCITVPGSFTLMGQVYPKDSLFSKTVTLTADFEGY